MDRTESGNWGTEPAVELEIGKIPLLKRVGQFINRLGKTKYAILLFLVGAFLLLVQEKPKPVPASAPAEIVPQRESSVEDRIAAVLSTMEGAGRVEVMLTVKNEGEIIYQTNLEERRSDAATDTRIETVFGSKTGHDGALVRQKNAPEYLGALVLAQGGENPAVQYRIKLAVSSLTGLGTDKITVLKMK